MADPIEPRTSLRSKWFWLLIIILLGVVLLVWLLRAETTDESALKVDAPIGAEEESALPAPQEEAVEIEIPDSDFELTPSEAGAEPENDTP